MTAPTANSRVLRFGTFELDLAAGELRKSGRKVRVQEQPFQLLAALVEKPGEVVTREELKHKLWPGDTYVDFDRSLNTAASKLRDALGDSASSPRFIETLPRRGYRFLASIESVGGSAPGRQGSSGVAADPPGDGRLSASHKLEQQNRLLRIGFTAAVTVSLLVMGLLVFQWLDQPSATDAMPLRKLSFTPPERLIRQWNAAHLAVSPNGRYVAFVAGDARTVWIRDLANEPAREITGTENAQFPSVADDGTLVYVDFGVAGEGRELVWMDRSRDGKLGTVGQPQNGIRNIDLSPDETRVAVTAAETDRNEIWVHEVERPVKTRITFSSGDTAVSSHWSPSGSELLFSSITRSKPTAFQAVSFERVWMTIGRWANIGEGRMQSTTSSITWSGSRNIATKSCGAGWRSGHGI